MHDSENILKQHKLRVTDVRKSVLDVFGGSKVALSQNDIELNLANIDRITLYRTLRKFESSGILHKVLNDSHQVKYAICIDDCMDGHHFDSHVHFHCTNCGNTECLDTLPIPEIIPPANYRKDSMEILMKGICKHCNS